jgi:hypothetical protein
MEWKSGQDHRRSTRQMPQLTYSSSDTESGSSHDGLEIFPPPARTEGEMSEETETKGYNTNMIVVGSEEADMMDDGSNSPTRGMGKNLAGDEHVNRISASLPHWM